MCGTYRATSETRKTKRGFLSRKLDQEGSLREVHEYRVHPDIFKTLSTGQVIKISGLRDTEITPINIDLRSDYGDSNFRESLKFEVKENVKRETPQTKSDSKESSFEMNEFY